MSHLTEKFLYLLFIAVVAATVFFTYPIFGVKSSVVLIIFFVILGIVSNMKLKKADTMLNKLFDGKRDEEILSIIKELNKEDRSEIIYLMKRKPEKYHSILQQLKNIR